MKAEELRIGNWFIGYDNIEYQWTLENFKMVLDGVCVDEIIKSYVPLTEEWLLRFGFTHEGSLWFKHNKQDFAIRKWKQNQIDVYDNYSYISHDKHTLVFSGNIKNKSELKKLMEMLGINKIEES